jgi:hypothetical protein
MTDDLEYIREAETQLKTPTTIRTLHDPTQLSALRDVIESSKANLKARKARKANQPCKVPSEQHSTPTQPSISRKAPPLTTSSPRSKATKKQGPKSTPDSPTGSSIPHENVKERWARIQSSTADLNESAMEQARERYQKRFNGHTPEEEKLVALEHARSIGQVRQNDTQRTLKASLQILLKAFTGKSEQQRQLLSVVTDTSKRRDANLVKYVDDCLKNAIREVDANEKRVHSPVVRATLAYLLSNMYGQPSPLSIDTGGPWVDAQAIIRGIADTKNPNELIHQALLIARTLGEPYIPWEHGIRREFTLQRRKRFIVVDAEWKPIPVRMDADGGVSQVRSEPLPIRLFSAYDGETFRDHETVEQFITAEFVPENSGAYMFALNGGRADFPVLFDFMKRRLETDNKDKAPEQLHWQISLLRKGGRNFCMIIRKGRYDKLGKWKTKYTWTLIDFLVFVQKSLEEIGSKLNIDKGVGELGRKYLEDKYGCAEFSDLSQDEKEEFYAEAPIEVLIEYNRTDLRILHAAVASYETTVLRLGGSLKLTGSSTSLHIGRRMYLREDIETNSALNRAIENAYVGGRTEIFRASLDHGWYQDINSSYPFSFDRALPGSFIETHTKTLPRLIPERDQQGRLIGVRFGTPVIIDATVTVPDEGQLLNVVEAREKHLYPDRPFRRNRRLAVPPLPFKFEDKQKEQHLFYPVGRWRSWFSGPDIEALIEATCIDLEELCAKTGEELNKALGSILQLHEVHYFKPTTDFREYMLDVYELRKQAKERGDEAETAWLKLISNGFYGKLGEGEEREEDIIGWDDAKALEESDELNISTLNGRDVSHGAAKTSVPIAVGAGRRRDKPKKAPPGSKLGVTLNLKRIGGNHWRRAVLVHVPHRHLPMASYVVGDARKRIWRFAQASEDLAYIDTDSVQSGTRHPDGDNLGDLKTEYAIGYKGHPCVYAAEKCYKIWARKVKKGEVTNEPANREKKRQLLLPRERPTDQAMWTKLKRTFEEAQVSTYGKRLFVLPQELPTKEQYDEILKRNPVKEKPAAVLKYKGVNRINENEWDRLVAGAVLPDKRPTTQWDWRKLKKKYEDAQQYMQGKILFELPNIIDLKDPDEKEYKTLLRQHRVVQRRNASINDKLRSGLDYHHEILFYKRTHEREMPKRCPREDGTTSPWSTTQILDHFFPKQAERKKTA